MEKVDIKYKILDPDNCVMCGMCMSYCPTYKISNNESESPRGRISIIYGLNNKMLEPSESALNHINSCTLCLACESVCPKRKFLSVNNRCKKQVLQESKKYL